MFFFQPGSGPQRPIHSHSPPAFFSERTAPSFPPSLFSLPSEGSGDYFHAEELRYGMFPKRVFPTLERWRRSFFLFFPSRCASREHFPRTPKRCHHQLEGSRGLTFHTGRPVNHTSSACRPGVFLFPTFLSVHRALARNDSPLRVSSESDLSASQRLSFSPLHQDTRASPSSHGDAPVKTRDLL